MTPPNIQKVFLIAGFLAILFICISVSSFQIYWGESSFITLKSWQSGSAHPPGYPFFLQAVKLGQLIPIGDIAYRSNTVGSFYAALSFLLILVFFGSDRWVDMLIGFYAGSLYLLSPQLMSANAAVEVYTLNIAFILLIIHFLKNKIACLKVSLIVSFIAGIAVTHHLTFLLLLPLVLYHLVKFGLAKDTMQICQKLSLILIIFFLGTSVWLYLPVREIMVPTGVWGNPSGLKGFFDLITAAEESRSSLLSGITDSTQLVARFKLVGSAITQTLHPLGILLALTGIYYLFKKNRMILLNLACYFSILVVMVGLYNSNETQSFFLPGTLICCIWSGVGIKGILEYLDTIAASRLSFYRAVVFLIALIPITSTVASIEDRISSGVSVPRWLATNMANLMDMDDMLFSKQSDVCFLNWYLIGIEKHQTPVAIFQHLLSFPWYYKDLVKMLPAEKIPELALGDFEDSWEWNRYAFARIVQKNIESHRIWITDPEAIEDLRLAGLKNISIQPQHLFACISHPSNQIPPAISQEIPIQGRLDPVSAMALIRWYAVASFWYQLSDRSEMSEIMKIKSEEIRKYAILKNWWDR